MDGLDLDPGIVAVVEAVVARGFRTIASCQGHGEEDAWIAVLPGTLPVEVAATYLRDWLRGSPWKAYALVEAVYPVDDSEPFIRLRWWGKVPFR